MWFLEPESLDVGYLDPLGKLAELLQRAKAIVPATVWDIFVSLKVCSGVSAFVSFIFAIFLGAMGGGLSTELWISCL